MLGQSEDASSAGSKTSENLLPLTDFYKKIQFVMTWTAEVFTLAPVFIGFIFISSN